jgi:hypothetical protein
MKMRKKWILTTLMILGIGGSWLSKNTWITQKEVETNNYTDSISKTKWVDENKGVWHFNKDGNLTVINQDYLKNESWKIDEHLLITKGDYDLAPATWKIKTFKTNYMKMVLIEPSVNGFQPNKKLIRIE